MKMIIKSKIVQSIEDNFIKLKDHHKKEAMKEIGLTMKDMDDGSIEDDVMRKATARARRSIMEIIS